jgi:hypothetical protein
MNLHDVWAEFTAELAHLFARFHSHPVVVAAAAVKPDFGPLTPAPGSDPIDHATGLGTITERLAGGTAGNGPASTAAVPSAYNDGNVLDTPRIGYSFPEGSKAFTMPVKASVIYTLEVIPPGYGAGKVSIVRGDGVAIEHDIINGFCSAFPVQAAADETWAVTVTSSSGGGIRFWTNA